MALRAVMRSDARHLSHWREMEADHDEHIQEKIEMNERKFDYKNHRIWLHSYELKAGGWVPRAVVVLPSEHGDGQQELLYPSEGTFPMREEADRQAFEMGKRWIDERLAGEL